MEIALADGKTFKPTQQLLTTMNEDLEALESIYQCGLTQERISNDVLSLGRIQLGESGKERRATVADPRYAAYVMSGTVKGRADAQRYTMSIRTSGRRRKKFSRSSRTRRG